MFSVLEMTSHRASNQGRGKAEHWARGGGGLADPKMWDIILYFDILHF